MWKLHQSFKGKWAPDTDLLALLEARLPSKYRTLLSQVSKLCHPGMQPPLPHIQQAQAPQHPPLLIALQDATATAASLARAVSSGHANDQPTDLPSSEPEDEPEGLEEDGAAQAANPTDAVPDPSTPAAPALAHTTGSAARHNNSLAHQCKLLTTGREVRGPV